jgi:predicted  nucleic acid-binding Zn-ribbon protein
LENEKARLNRELDNWNGRKNSAEKKLAKVEEELAMIKTLLLGDPQVRSMRNTTRPRLKEDSYVAPESQTGVLFEY